MGVADGAVELEDVLVDHAQGARHPPLVQAGGVAEHGHLALGRVLVAQGDGGLHYLLELRVHGGFAVAGEGDDVGQRVLLGHLAELVLELPGHLAGLGQAGGAGTLAVVARLAVEAVVGAHLAVVGHQVDSQREAQATRVDRSEHRVVE